MSQQENWRFCQKCEAMFFDGYADKGLCPGGGGHLAQGYNFNLPYGLPESITAQDSWRCCSKCHEMFYDGYADKGHCMGGGGHLAQGYNFTLPHDVADTSTAQASWRYCRNCHAMFYNGYSPKGACPGFAGHVAQGYNFVLPHDTPVAPPPAGSPQFSLVGNVWVVGLSHQQAEAVEGSLGALAPSIAYVAAVTSPCPPAAALIAAVGGALGAAAGIIQLMDAIGGDNGVDVQGILGIPGVIVTPHASGIFGTPVEAGRVVVAGATIADLILKAGSTVPAGR